MGGRKSQVKAGFIIFIVLAIFSAIVLANFTLTTDKPAYGVGEAVNIEPSFFRVIT